MPSPKTPPLTKPELVLLDIDGTLLITGNDAFIGFKRTMSDFAAEGFCRYPGPPEADFNGTTDSLILTEYLKVCGYEGPESEPGGSAFNYARRCYEQMMIGSVLPWNRERAEGYRLPGANRLIADFGRRGVATTLLTGNFSRVAEAKLKEFGVQPVDYSIGAYGEDSAKRTDLAAVALGRAQAKFGSDFAADPKSVMVIGDTPGDHAVAVTGGFTSVLVATGKTSFEDLQDLNPEACVQSLNELTNLLAADFALPGR